MMSQSTIVGPALFIFALCALASCEVPFPRYEYKLTLKFSEDGQVREGSSVVQISPYSTWTIDTSGFEDKRKGQATIVDLGSGRYVFALLTGGKKWGYETSRLLSRLYNIKFSLSDGGNSLRDLSIERGPRDLKPDDLPTLVIFDDVLNPSTARVIDPSNPANVLPSNIQFVGATVEVTDEPITTGISKLIPRVRSENAPRPYSMPCVSGYCLSPLDFAYDVS